MTTRLYGIPLSHPAIAVRRMLERKGLDYRYTDLLGGAHPVQLRALGFRTITVPALRFADGARVQGSLDIAAELERRHPEPTLYPHPASREAERWGEAVLQAVPRRLIRWGLHHALRQRQWFADVATPLPAPRIIGALLTPVVPLFVKQAGATDAAVRADLAALPGHLDHVDALIAEGVIGTDAPGAADFQIGSSIAVLLASADVSDMVAGRPCAALARRTAPGYPPIPAVLPRDWIG